MKKTLPFDTHVAEYEEWYQEYPFVFQSEVEALRQMLPEGERLTGIEVGLGTGQFAKALGIKEGVEPSPNMRAIALRRGIDVVDGVAENLPYKDLRFDFVIMAFSVCYFDDLHRALKEAHRVLKNDGVLIIGFLDRNSIIGKQYEQQKPESIFYREANFYSVEKMKAELTQAKFKQLEFCQTLFKPLDDIKAPEPAKPGFGEGSFVVVQAKKRI